MVPGLRSVGEIYPVWRLHHLIGMGGDQLVTAVGGEELERRVGDRVCSYGFGDDELLEAGAKAIYDTPRDLTEALGTTPLA